MKRIPAGLRKVGRPINIVSPQRWSESEAGPAFSGTSVSLEHHTQTEQVLERGTH